MKTEFMQTANFLTIELQFRDEGSNNYHFKKIVKKKPVSLTADIGQVCRCPVFCDLASFLNNVRAVLGVVTSRSFF